MRSLADRRTIVLTERRPRLVRLSRDDATFLLEHPRGNVEVLPSTKRGWYRLTALGCVGTLITPQSRILIRTKIPMANVLAMLDPQQTISTQRDYAKLTPGTEMLDWLARLFAFRLSKQIANGLPRSYVESRESGSVLHGQFDLASQLREAPGRKDQIHGRMDELTIDNPINRVIKATADLLLVSSLVSEDVKSRLRQALLGFEGVSSRSWTPDLWDNSDLASAPEDVQPLLALCRLLIDGLEPGLTAGMHETPSFLLYVDRLFERYVSRGVSAAFASVSECTVEQQATHGIGNFVSDTTEFFIRPDLTIRRDGKAALIVDVKWKNLQGGVSSEDLYQILTYGTTLGAHAVALVYPGKRWQALECKFTHTSLRLFVYELRVRGSRAALTRSLAKLGSALRSLL